MSEQTTATYADQFASLAAAQRQLAIREREVEQREMLQDERTAGGLAISGCALLLGLILGFVGGRSW